MLVRHHFFVRALGVPHVGLSFVPSRPRQWCLGFARLISIFSDSSPSTAYILLSLTR